MKTARGALTVGLGIILLVVVQATVARGAEPAGRPSETVIYPQPFPIPSYIVLGAQLNGQSELPPNNSPLCAAARFTLRRFLPPLPPLPPPTHTNFPPILTNLPPVRTSPPPVLPPIVLTNLPPIIVVTNRPPPVFPTNPPPILLTNPFPIFPTNPPVILNTNPLPPLPPPPTGGGGSSGGVVLQGLAVTPTEPAGGYPGYPGQPGPGPFPPGTTNYLEITNYLEGYVVFPPSVLTNALGLVPSTATLEDEAGNTLSNLVVFGTSPIGIFTGNLDEAIFPISGGFVLTSQQRADLLAGHWFVRVAMVTASGEDYPAGAIRGRIMPVDSDGDGVADYLDICPGTEPGAVVDTNGCSVAQHCPCLGYWQNHGEYVGCVQTTASSFLQQGLISAGERDALVREAAGSDCGKRLIPAAPHSGITGQSVLYFGGAYGSVPYPTSLKILSPSGSLLTQARTDLEGRFEVNLPPGVYTVMPWLQTLQTSPPGSVVLYPIAEPATVTVPFKQFTNVVVTYSFLPWEPPAPTR